MSAQAVAFDEQKFRMFQSRRSSVGAYFRVMIGLTFFIMRDLLIAYFVRFSFTKMIKCILLSGVLFCGWTLCSLKYYIQHDENASVVKTFQRIFLVFYQTIFRNHENMKLTDIIHVIEDIFIDVSTLGIGVALIYKSTYGDCGSLSFLLSTATCNYEHACGSLPDDLTSFFVIVPLVHKVLFKGADWKAILRSTAITTSMILYCIVVTKSWSSLYLLFVTLPFVLMMLFELRRQSIEMFMVTETLNQSLQDNEKMAEELRLHEMKMMIGNIAHDLKTPLTAFFSGLDEINTLSHDLKTKLTHLFKVQKTSSPKQYSSKGDSILWSRSKDTSILKLEEAIFHMIDHVQQCVETSKSINSFMLMSINRCIDFTKVRHGVTLKSKMETGCLQDLLNVPLNCMRDMQSLIEIKLFPPPSSICSHIITDKQWFQENLLCLVSNAVKYSSKGKVTIKVSLWQPYSNDNNNDGSNRQQNESTSAKSTSSSDGSSHNGNGGGHVKFNDRHDKTPPTTNSKLYRLRSNTMTTTKNNDIIPTFYSYSTCSPKDFNDIIHMRIEVQDEGIGIPFEAMGNLFAPFKQAQRLAGGTGLGLFSLAKRIESLNGYYGVEPRSDGQQGSVFWFSFPYQPDKASAKLHKAEMKGYDIGTTIIDHHRYEDSSCSAPASPMKGSQVNGQDHLEREFQQSTSEKHKKHRRSATEGNLDSISSRLLEKMKPVVDRVSKSNMNNKNLNDTQLQVDIVLSEPVRAGNEAITCKYTDRVNIERDKSDDDDDDDDDDDSAADTEEKEEEKYNVVARCFNKFVALNILIVDDSLPIRKVLTSMLKTQGHTVVTATNGAESLDRLAEQHAAHNGMPFDVILMDMQMPVMDGLEATRRIRAEEAKNNNISSSSSNSNSSSGGSSTSSSGNSSGSGISSSSNESILNATMPSEDAITVTGRSGYCTKLAINTNRNSHNYTRPRNIDNNNANNNSSIGNGISSSNSSIGSGRSNSSNSNNKNDDDIQTSLIDHHHHYHQNILALSANSDDDTIATAFEVGVDEFMPKPFTIKSLYEKLQIIHDKQLKSSSC